MKPKKAIKELRRQLKGDSGNLVLLIRLASLLRDIGQYGEAIQIYIQVAQAYHASNRIGQAIAVCKGVLEFAPQEPTVYQMLQYLEQSRMQSESDAALINEPPLPPPSPPPHQAVSRQPVPDEGNRRKRPTSFPTPLTDEGRISVLPGFTGARNARPLEGHTLSPSAPAVDVTVPGAPPSTSKTTSEFRLSSLTTPTPPKQESTDSRELPALPGTTGSSAYPPSPKAPPRRPLPLSPGGNDPVVTPREKPPRRAETFSPPTVAPGKQAMTGDVMRNIQHGQAEFRPPTLAPEPTPIPEGGPPPPPPLQGRDTADESYEPELEDATIVNADFDLAQFMAEQEASEADLPAIPSSSANEEQTRVAGFEETGGVLMEQLVPFRSLPQYALRELARGASLDEYPPGYMILSEDDHGDACYVLCRGEVQVLKRNPLGENAPLQEVARLGDGALFGEFALLGDGRRHASVRTTTTSTIVEISGQVINGLRSRFPAVQPVLELFYRERMIQTLMNTASFFKVLSDNERSDVVGLFEPVRAAPGQALIREGERSGGFYLILLGSVGIDKRRDDGSQARVVDLGEGGYFGEVSLLRGDVSQASVTALTTVELARLSAASFYSLVAGNPQLWAQIWAEANRREVETLQIVAGVTSNV